MKKPRLIAVIPLRSARARGHRETLPIIAVTTPIAGTITGEGETGVAERGRTEDERCDERHRVRLEEVGGHARAVTDVVAHVVGDGGRVARVVLRDALLHLAHQVGADIRGLGEDPAADPHEHGDQRRAETEPLQHLGRVGGVDEHHTGGPEQAESHRDHSDHATGTESDLHRFVRDGGEILFRFPLRWSRLTRGRGHPHIAPHGEPHADVSGSCREKRTHQEEEGTPGALRPVVGRQQEQQEEHDDGENTDRAQLPGQIGVRALLDRRGDLLHAFGALAGRQDLAYEQLGDDQRGDGDDRHHDDDQPVAVGEYRRREGGGSVGKRGFLRQCCHWGGEELRHTSSLTLSAQVVDGL